MSATPMETWSNMGSLLYNLITGYMVMTTDRACQPVNRLLSPEDESPRSLPGVRQHALLARPGRAHRDAESAGGSRGMDGRQWRAAGGQAAGAARVRAGDRAARDPAPPVRRRGAAQDAGRARPCRAQRGAGGGPC